MRSIMRSATATLVLLILTFGFGYARSYRCVQEPQLDDKPLTIRKKPQASARGCRRNSSGVTRLRVTFDETGVIGEVAPVSTSGCLRFDDSAVTAAKMIEFDPAIKNGQPVTVKKLIEYSFRVY